MKAFSKIVLTALALSTAALAVHAQAKPRYWPWDVRNEDHSSTPSQGADYMVFYVAGDSKEYGRTGLIPQHDPLKGPAVLGTRNKDGAVIRRLEYYGNEDNRCFFLHTWIVFNESDPKRQAALKALEDPNYPGWYHVSYSFKTKAKVPFVRIGLSPLYWHSPRAGKQFSDLNYVLIAGLKYSGTKIKSPNFADLAAWNVIVSPDKEHKLLQKLVPTAVQGGNIPGGSAIRTTMELWQFIPVTPGQEVTISFWAKGDKHYPCVSNVQQ